MVARMVPADLPVKVPILVGFVKSPLESDNCAVKTLLEP